LQQSLDTLLSKVKSLTLTGSPAGSHTQIIYQSAEEADLEKKFVPAFLSHRYGPIESLIGIFSEYLKRKPNRAVALGRLAYLNVWKQNERYVLGNIPVNVSRAITDRIFYFDKSLSLAPKHIFCKGFGTNCKLFS